MKVKPTIAQLQQLKDEGKHFTMITVYDHAMAQLVDRSQTEMILVGDSLGMIIQGHEGTTPVTIEHIQYHLQWVRKGAPNTFIIGDMPFLSYQASKEDAILNAGSLIRLGADCVKMEGGMGIMDKIEAVTSVGIPVCAHIGLTPQSVASLGGFKVQGKGKTAAKRLVDEAIAAEKAGAFAIVLECIPTQLADYIMTKINIPAIGVGAGPNTAGHNINAYDLIGMFDAFIPKFVKRYGEIGKEIVEIYDTFHTEVQNGEFPQKSHEYNMDVNDLPQD